MLLAYFMQSQFKNLIMLSKLATLEKNIISSETQGLSTSMDSEMGQCIKQNQN